MSRAGTRIASVVVSAAAVMALGADRAGAVLFGVHTNNGAITIPARGNASPYPSTIPATQPGAITDITLTLDEFSHTFTSDVGAVLVGQDGRALLFMDLVGEDDPPGSTATNIDLTFDDAAATLAPDSGAVLGAGTYKPTARFDTFFPAPGPGFGYFAAAPIGGATFGSTFDGFSANQTWRLFVRDTGDGDSGSIAMGWSLGITTEPSIPAAPSVTGTVPASGSDNNTPSVTGSAEPGTTVNLYRSGDCGGAAAASGSAAQFGSSGIPVSVSDNTVSTFNAKAFSATGSSRCSASFATYLERTPAVKKPPAGKKHRHRCKRKKRRRGRSAEAAHRKKKKCKRKRRRKK